MDRGLIASLRETSRPVSAEALLVPRTSSPGGVDAYEQLQSVVEDLVTRMERMEEQLHRLQHSGRAEAEVAAHTLFVPTATGYAIVERDGPPPRPGEEVVIDGTTYSANGYRRSPFPADRRSCVIVEATETG